MTLDWDILSDEDFEELCYKILETESFYNLKWMGRGGKDRGRDITCKKDAPIFDNVSIKTEYSYLAQCKKYVARPPGPSDFENTIAWANVHKPDVLLLMVSNILSSTTNDWIEQREEDTKYKIFVFDEKNFEQFFDSHNEIYKSFFESEKGYYNIKIEGLKILVLNYLLDKDKRSISEIAIELGIDNNDTVSTVSELVDEGLLINSEDDSIKYSLNESIEAFKNISKYLLPSDFKYRYLLSMYACDTINMKLVNYINDRFFLKLNDKEKKQLHVLLSISPTSLYDALFINTQLYKNAHDHLIKLKLSDEKSNKWKESMTNQFFMMLLQKTLIDLQHPECTNIIKEKGIRGMKIDIELNLATLEELIFGMKTLSLIALHKAAGPIKAGQLVSATDPDLFIEQGTVEMQLGMFDLAINDFNKAIEQVKDMEKLLVAWNNKGVTLMRQEKWADAIECFEKALEIDPNLVEAKNNIASCLEKISNEKGV